MASGEGLEGSCRHDAKMVKQMTTAGGFNFQHVVFVASTPF